MSDRTDVGDAVRAARESQAGWAARSGAERGRVLYRLAEALEERAGRLDMEAAVEAAVWWAGLADKLDQLLGAVNPVAGPFLNVSAPIPVGVCALACPADDDVAGVVQLIAPALIAGNAAVAVVPGPAASSARPLAEAIAAAGAPEGALALLTGDERQLLTRLADHDDVDLMDLTGAPGDMVADLEARAAAGLKRIARTGGGAGLATAAAFCDIRTVWHPARI